MSFNELCRKPVRFSKPFVDLYGSFVGLYGSFVDLYKPFVDLYESFVGLYKLFVDLYNPFGDLSLLSTLYSPHGPQDHLSD